MKISSVRGHSGNPNLEQRVPKCCRNLQASRLHLGIMATPKEDRSKLPLEDLSPSKRFAFHCLPSRHPGHPELLRNAPAAPCAETRPRSASSIRTSNRFRENGKQSVACAVALEYLSCTSKTAECGPPKSGWKLLVPTMPRTYPVEGTWHVNATEYIKVWHW